MKPLILTLMMFASTPSFATEDGNYKMAIISDGIAAKELKSGDFASAISKLSDEKNDNALSTNMNLCVAYARSSNWDASEQACNDAIDTLATLDASSATTHKLQALAYTNRGVLRQAKKDFNGALSDFKTAVKIKDNDITLGNLVNFIDKNQDQIDFIAD